VVRRGDWVLLLSEDGLKIVARHRGRLETIRGYVEASALDGAEYGGT